MLVFISWWGLTWNCCFYIELIILFYNFIESFLHLGLDEVYLAMYVFTSGTIRNSLPRWWFSGSKVSPYVIYALLPCSMLILNLQDLLLFTHCKVEMCSCYLKVNFNTFNLSIFVFSKYIKYFLPINLFIRLLVSCIN